MVGPLARLLPLARLPRDELSCAMSYPRSLLTWSLALYLLSVLVTSPGKFLGEVPPPHAPGLVDKADGWVQSKAKHRDPNDFFTRLEKVHFTKLYTWMYDGTAAFKRRSK